MLTEVLRAKLKAVGDLATDTVAGRVESLVYFSLDSSKHHSLSSWNCSNPLILHPFPHRNVRGLLVR